MAQELGASERQTRKAKQSVADGGILTSPNPKTGKTLTTDTENIVKAFYNDDENSRIMPGKQDFVSLKRDYESREHVQKRLVLCNLSELYARFKSEYPGVKIGLSKFSQLIPRNGVLAGASGTHTVCVCVHHENVNLMLDAINIQKN